MSDKQRNALLQAQAWLERQAAIASGQADDIPDEDYADMFNAVLELIEDALEEPTGWQPIETAPRDGSILVFGQPTDLPDRSATFSGPAAHVAYWDEIDGSYCLSGATWL